MLSKFRLTRKSVQLGSHHKMRKTDELIEIQQGVLSFGGLKGKDVQALETCTVDVLDSETDYIPRPSRAAEG